MYMNWLILFVMKIIMTNSLIYINMNAYNNVFMFIIYHYYKYTYIIFNQKLCIMHTYIWISVLEKENNSRLIQQVNWTLFHIQS